MSIKVAEFFAGSRSVGKQAERLGMEVFSVDVNPKFEGISLVADMEFVKPSDLPWKPDIIWASPPCTTYSLAGISHHRDPDGTPRSDFAAKSDRLVRNTIELIKAFPDALFYMENPRACLRNMSFMAALPEPVTVWYCRYGDSAAKPTDIWTNNLATLFNPRGWKPRPECWNGNRKCHHEAAPRGYAAKKKLKDAGLSNLGTQGKRNAYERSRVPDALCLEALIAAVDIIPKQRELTNTAAA